MMHGTASTRRPGKSVLVFVSLVTVFASIELRAQQQRTPSEHEALWDQATLVVDSLTLSPLRVRNNWPFEKRVGPYLICLEDNALEVVDFASLNPVWKETGSRESAYRLLGADERTLYLVEEHRVRSRASADISVLRRELSTGKALETILLAEESGDEHSSSRLIDAIIRPDCVYLLTMLVSRADGSTKPVSYRLTKFSDTVDWSRKFDSAGALESPGAFLLDSLGPALDRASSEALVDRDSRIIVNAGPLEDVMVVNSESGQVEWTVPRLWEHRRGFIGPSVWNYFLGRYGMEHHDIETASMTLEEIKEENKREFLIDEEYFLTLKEQLNAARDKIESEQGWIVAGPVAIEAGSEGGDTRLFIVTAQSDGSSSWPNYLANAVVYELGIDGELISMVTLPRFVRPDASVVLSDRILWHCEGRARLELFPTPNRFSNDTFTKINWKSASKVPQRKAWLRQGRYSSARVYHESRMFSMVEGGYLEDKTSQQLRYPILVTNLESGERQQLLLHLPFQGQPYQPTTNYSRGPNGWVSLRKYLFTITSIQADDSLLSITFENEERERTVLEFAMSTIIKSLKKD